MSDWLHIVAQMHDYTLAACILAVPVGGLWWAKRRSDRQLDDLEAAIDRTIQGYRDREAEFAIERSAYLARIETLEAECARHRKPMRRRKP